MADNVRGFMPPSTKRALGRTVRQATADRRDTGPTPREDPNNELMEIPALWTDYDQYTGRCAWHEQTFDPMTGARKDLPFGRFGTFDASPAYPIGNGPLPPPGLDAGIEIWIRFRTQTFDLGPTWEFDWQGDECFLATLTAKDYSGPFITYSWTRVEGAEVLSDPADPDSPKTIVYTLQDDSGGPGNFPAYHEQNIDLAICSSQSGSGSGLSGSGNPITGGGDCYCVGRIVSTVNNGDGTLTWTFDSLQCCEDQTLDAPSGACAPCPETSPCDSGTVTVTAAVGTYITTPGYWVQLGTVCHSGGDETPETCVVRLCRGRGDWYYIDHEPRWEVVEIGDGAGGSYTGWVMSYDPISGQLFKFKSCTIIDANSLP